MGKGGRQYSGRRRQKSHRRRPLTEDRRAPLRGLVPL